MNNFLFVLRSYPDIDHIAPMIWKCLEKGDRTILVFDQPYPYKEDYRIQFLMKYPRCEVLHLLGVESTSPWMRMASRIVWNYYTVRSLLKRYQCSACFFEWGEGVLPHGRLRLLTELRRSLTKAKTKKVGTTGFQLAPFLQLLSSRILRPLRMHLIMATRDCSIPIFALPHGISTKLNIDYHPLHLELMHQNGGQLPLEDRNCFTAWVFSAEFHRQLMINHARMDPKIAQTWGSLRFCREWMEILKEICPKAPLPPKQDGQVRLVFFLPKWGNLVDKQQTIALLKTIAEHQAIQLILKTHPRKGTSELEEEFLTDLLNHPNVSLAGDAHSSALIQDSDIVVDIGSSMAIEALLEAKYLIYPAYLHKNRLVFDAYGGCLIAHSQSDVHLFLDSIVLGVQPRLAETEIEHVLREVVYGGREPFDVPEDYYRRVQSYLAGHRLERAPRQPLPSPERVLSDIYDG
jgi:hypothetical protein